MSQGATELEDTSTASSGHRIVEVRAHCLKLPYRKPVAFANVTQNAAEYILLRLILDNGEEGIAESVCRPEFSGEDARSLSYTLGTLFKPALLGGDPMAHAAVIGSLSRFKGLRAAKALVDIALWDLRGKLLGRPVWSLLGGGPVQPVPLTWVAHGNTRDAMVEECRKMAGERGYRGMKIKTWRRSDEDVRAVEAVRTALGDKATIYIDANSTYTETEARTILSRVAPFGVAFIEDPCRFTSLKRMAAMAEVLPVAILGDELCDSLSAVYQHIEAGAVGGVSVKLRRTGFTESLKIIALCEAAGLPVVIGTDSESRISAMARVHLRMAVPSLAPWPIETHFFDKLAADVFAGDFPFSDGQITPTDAPGFGVGVDLRRLEEFSF